MSKQHDIIARIATCRDRGQLKERIGYIDIAKAIAIIFIIWGHFATWAAPGTPQILADFGYTFHVPLFFIASGYFIKIAKPYDLKTDAKKLLLPYVVSCLFIIGLNVVHVMLRGAPLTEIAGEAWKWLNASLYGSGSASNVTLWPVDFIGGLWFLWALFWGRMILFAVHKLPYPIIWIVGFFCAGYFTSEFVWLPCSLQTGMCTALYLFIGMKCRELDLFADKKLPVPVWLLMLLTWALLVLYGHGFFPVSNTYPHGILDFVGAICASFCVIAFSKWIEKKVQPVSRFMQWIGRNTLPIFCLHIVDLDCFPTLTVQAIIGSVTSLPQGVIVVILHYGLVAIMCGVVYLLPRPISGIFFPQKLKRPVETAPTT